MNKPKIESFLASLNLDSRQYKLVIGGAFAVVALFIVGITLLSRSPVGVQLDQVPDSEIAKYIGEDAVADGISAADFEQYQIGLVKDQVSQLGYDKAIQLIAESVESTHSTLGLDTIFITPDSSGELSNGFITVSFPKGAVSEPVVATFRTLTGEVGDYQVLGTPYELTATTIYGQQVSRFNKPLTITTTFTDNDLDQSSLRDVSTYYLDEQTRSWDRIASRLDGEKLISSTDHFSTYTTSVDEPEEPTFDKCGLFIDDSFAVIGSDGVDRTACFESGGNWQSQEVGVRSTSMFTKTPGSAVAWFPNPELIDGTYEIFAFIPKIFSTDDEGNDLELKTDFYYTVYDGANIYNGTINVEDALAESGSRKVSLGEFSFSTQEEIKVGLFVPFVEDSSEYPKYIVADAICFGECPEGVGGDMTPPVFENVFAEPFDGKYEVEAEIYDPESGVKSAYISVQGKITPMDNEGDGLYSAVAYYEEGKDNTLYLIAYNNVGLASIWVPGRGYVTRGPGMNIGIPPEASWYLNYKSTVNNSLPAPTPGTNRCSPCAGDPVNTLNGNLLEQIEILSLPGRPEIRVSLTYNGLGGRLGIFGFGWSYDYGYRIVEMRSSRNKGAILTYPTGYTTKFTGSEFSAPPGNQDTLEKTGSGFVLTKQDKTKIFFNEFGNISRWEDINGNGLNFEYISQDRFTSLSQPAKITADGGRFLEFEYSDTGLVSTIDVMGGEKQIRFDYSDKDDLIAVTDANGGVTSYGYNDFNSIKSKTSPEGRVIYQNQYDGKRRMIKQIAGESFTQEYIYLEGKTQIKDLNGTVAEYGYDDNGMMIYSIDEMSNKTTFEYNDKKQLVAEVDPEGNRTTYAYDESGNKAEVTDAEGFTVKTEYNQFNRPTKIENKLSDHVSTFEYDSKGNITKSTDALGNVKTYSYNSFGQLVEVRDAKGSVTTFDYNSYGDLITSTDALGGVVSLEYDVLGRKISETNPEGNTFNFSYDLNNNLLNTSGPLGFNLVNTYDANNKLTSSTDSLGNTTTYSYDGSENLVTMTDPLGGVYTKTYGQMNELVSVIDPLGRVTINTYNPNYTISSVTNAYDTAVSATTEFDYNGLKIQTKITDPEGRVADISYSPTYKLAKAVADATAKQADIKYTYDAVGNIITQIDSEGNVTTFTYDPLDRLLTQTDAQGNTIRYEYDQNSNVTKVTDPKSQVTTFSYDKLNRLVREVNPEGGVTTYEYDKNSNLIYQTNPKNITTRFEYDDLDRVTKKVDAYVSSAQITVIETQGLSGFFQNTQFDPSLDGIASNVVTTYEYDANSNVTRITNPRGYTTAFEYDALNRQVKVTDAKGNNSTMEYDAVSNLIKTTDRNGNSTTLTYDDLNRLVKQVDAEGNITKFNYDKVGNLVSITDPKGNVTIFTYDGLDNLTKITDALNGVTKFEYDKVGNKLAEVNANGYKSTLDYNNIYNLVASTNQEGHTTKFTYDANSNLTSFIDPKGGLTKFSHDKLNRTVKTVDAMGGVTTNQLDEIGNKLAVTDANGHTDSYTYDLLNRQTTVVDAEGNKSRLTYDANGNITKIQDANGHLTVLEYDELDRLVKQTNAEGEVTAFEYDNEGNQITKIDPDGVRTAYSYDDIYRLIDVSLNSVGSGKDTQTNVNTAYKYDPNSNLTQIINPNGYATSFSYDALNRQVAETDANGNTWRFGYDPVGNRTSRVDAKGNLTSYSYYPDNQQRSISYFDGTGVTHSYDPNNNQVSMTDNLGRSTWSYDKLNRVISEVDSLGRSKSYNYDAVGNTTKVTYPDGKQVSYRYLANNWLAGVTDPEGLVTTYNRDKVGNVVKTTNPNNTATTINYDKVYRQTEVVNFEVGGKINSSFQYTYDVVGQPVEVRSAYAWRQPGAVIETYQYDPIRRLTGSTNSVGTYNTYSYDRASNKVGWVSNNDATTPRPFDKTDLILSYNKINQLVRVRQNEDMPEPTGNKPVRETTPGRAKTVKNQTKTRPVPQVVIAFKDQIKEFINQVEAQRGKQVSETAYNQIIKQVEVIDEKAKAGLLVQDDARQLLDKLIQKIETLTAAGEIKSKGTETALITKLKNVKDFIEKLPKQLQLETYIIEVPVENTDTIQNIAGVSDPDPYRKVEFRYDSNGNRVRMQQYGPVGPEYQQTRYTYDPENRLETLTNFDSSKGQNWTTRDITVLGYDGLGRRLRKTYDPKADSQIELTGSGKKTTEYAFDGLDPIAEYNILNGQYSNLYRSTRNAGFGPQSRILSTQTFTSDHVKPKTYMHHDAVGSVVGITKDAGQGDKNYRYEDFGLLEGQTGQRSSHSAKDANDPINHYTYTGQEWDEFMNVYEFYSRSYDPVFGVWLRQDEYRGTQTMPQSLHRYNYVNQSPIGNWDVDGFYYGCDWYNVFCHGVNGIESVGNVAAAGASVGVDILNGVGQGWIYGVEAVYTVGYRTFADEKDWEMEQIAKNFQDARDTVDENWKALQTDVLKASPELMPDHCQEGLVQVVQGFCGTTSVVVDGYRPQGPQAWYVAINSILEASVVYGGAKLATKAPGAIKGLSGMSKSSLLKMLSSLPDDIARACKSFLDDAFKVGDDIAISSSKLQSKFKHAKDFGVTGNYNLQNADLFEQAIRSHILSDDVIKISGTYRNTQNVTHYLDEATNLNVIIDESGNFISGWKLGESQLKSILESGNLQ